jgi:hypothetical protein
VGKLRTEGRLYVIEDGDIIKVKLRREMAAVE